MAAVMILCGLVMLEPSPVSAVASRDCHMLSRVDCDDGYGDPIDLRTALEAVERGTPAERRAAILALAQTRDPSARPWLESLARGDAFARAWLGEDPDRSVRAAARLGLGILGGRAAEVELARLLLEGTDEDRTTVAATLTGLAVLRAEKGEVAPTASPADRALARFGTRIGLAPELREFAAVIGTGRTSDAFSGALAGLVRSPDVADWQVQARGFRRHRDPRIARLGRDLVAWLDEIEGARDPDEEAAEAHLVALRSRPEDARPALAPRTRLLLVCLPDCVPEAAPLLRDLGRAVHENARSVRPTAISGR